MVNADLTISINRNLITIKVNSKSNFDHEEDGELYLSDIFNFTTDDDGASYVLEAENNDVIIDAIVNHLGNKYEINFAGKLQEVFDRRESSIDEFEEFRTKGNEILDKEDNEHKIKLVNFDGFKKKGYKLFDYQKPSIALMNEIPNTANFSIPGSGKTIMAYASFFYLQKEKKVKQLFIISPRPSFGPWKELFEEVTDKKWEKHVKQYSGTIKQREKILRSLHKSDVVLCTFATATNDIAKLRGYFRNKMNGEILLLLDEAHHIKSIDATTASENLSASGAMIQLGKEVDRRCILTGTPMPHDWDDLWSQITFLWPFNEPFGSRNQFKQRIRNSLNIADDVAEIIESMWTRVSHIAVEDDLPETNFERIDVPMDKDQDDIYTMIESNQDRLPRGHGSARIREWKRARIIRLMQASSNPNLIIKNDMAFNVGALKPVNAKDAQIIKKIMNYKKVIPTKLKRVADHASKISDKGDNVVIFTQFRGNVHTLYDLLVKKGKKPSWITGEITDQEQQESLVRQFKEWAVNPKNKKGKILIATAGTLSESVSLHKLGKEHVCNNAIFLERSYDAGKFMQALHRIYRIGSNKKKTCNWYVYMSTPAKNSGVVDTVDTRIDQVLQFRLERLYDLLNDELLLRPLNIDSSDESDGSFGDDENQDDILNTIAGT